MLPWRIKNSSPRIRSAEPETSAPGYRELVKRILALEKRLGEQLKEQIKERTSDQEDQRVKGRLTKEDNGLRDVNIHIEHMHLHQPRLDSLKFELGQLDIKELSGAFNLGNNFGVKTSAGSGEAAKEKAKPFPGSSSSAKSSTGGTAGGTGEGITATSTGFKIKK